MISSVKPLVTMVALSASCHSRRWLCRAPLFCCSGLRCVDPHEAEMGSLPPTLLGSDDVWNPACADDELAVEMPFCLLRLRALVTKTLLRVVLESTLVTLEDVASDALFIDAPRHKSALESKALRLLRVARRERAMASAQRSERSCPRARSSKLPLC